MFVTIDWPHLIWIPILELCYLTIIHIPCSVISQITQTRVGKGQYLTKYILGSRDLSTVAQELEQKKIKDETGKTQHSKQQQSLMPRQRNNAAPAYAHNTTTPTPVESAVPTPQLKTDVVCGRFDPILKTVFISQSVAFE